MILFKTKDLLLLYFKYVHYVTPLYPIVMSCVRFNAVCPRSLDPFHVVSI